MNKNILRIIAVCFLTITVLVILFTEFKAYIIAPLAVADILLVFFAFNRNAKK
jgi:uncharacterized membrane protein